MSSTLSQSPTARGQQRWFFGMLAEVKASAADTGGQYSLVEITAPANHQVPLHVHYREDEGFYVLEGSVTIHVGEETVELAPASTRTARATSRTRSRRARRRPDALGARAGGFEDFIEDVSVPAEPPTVPPASVLPPENAAEIVLRHGMELLPD